MKRILITGSAGFVGANFVEYILNKTDWEIIGLDSLRHMGDSQRITKSERFHHFTHDLNVPITDVLSSKIGDVDIIVNIASESAIDRSIAQPESVVLNNVNLILNILDLARRKSVEKFVHLSTDEVYGQYYDVPHKEWAKIVPSNPYSASKACQEAIAISYWRTYGVPLSIVNCQNMFGKRQNPEKMIPKTIKYLNEGKTIPIYASNGKSGARKYIHVQNLCSAILFVTRRNVTKYKGLDTEELPDRYHVGGHDEIDNVTLVRLIAHHMGKVADYELVDEKSIRPGYDKKYALDDNKLKCLGWEPELNFQDSLKDVIDWTLKNPEWMS